MVRIEESQGVGCPLASVIRFPLAESRGMFAE